MEHSPYKTPESNLEIQSEFKRSVWWKIYFCVITIISAIGIALFLFDPAAGILEWISLIIWLFATAGLFSFTFLKPIYKPKFWQNVLIVYVVFNTAYYFITDIDLRAGQSDMEFYLTNAFSWLLILPSLYGLYALGKPSNPVWKKNVQ